MLTFHKLMAALPVFAILGMSLGGCSHSITLVNTRTFYPDEIHSIRLDYDADDITLLKSPDDSIILREYMNRDHRRYYTQVKERGGELFLTEGQRPLGAGFESRMELCLPAGYGGNLSLHTTSGRIDSDLPLEIAGEFSANTSSGILSLRHIEATTIELATTGGEILGENLQAQTIRVQSTSGPLSFSELSAESIDLETTSATAVLQNASGRFAYRSTSGMLSAENLSGAGSFEATGSGGMELRFSQVESDITAAARDGGILLELPAALNYTLQAKSKEGRINTPYPHLRETIGELSGIIGDQPTCTVSLETRDSDITVTQSN